ncbi:MAG: AAA family ATPase, partial [Bacteroidota bacterium]
LVERLRTHPYSLILFDEIEHAHENVLAVLLRLLSEGTLVDADGNIADARNSIVIMTSNLLGPEGEFRRTGFAPAAQATPGQPTQTEMSSLMERHLPRKLIDRLDAIIRFNPLTEGDLESIAGPKVDEVVARVKVLYGVSVAVSPEVLPWLAKKAASESCGARAIQRIVDSHFANPLGDVLIDMRTQGTGQVKVSVVNDEIQVEAASSDS